MVEWDVAALIAVVVVVVGNLVLEVMWEMWH